VRADPNVDVFGGADVPHPRATTRTATAPEIGNTGKSLLPMMKVTVRPAEGNEIKLGGVFQDYQYTSASSTAGRC